MPDMGKCYFVSDLHLFANRSNAHRYLEQIERTASHAEVFVLGGDTFDFRWAQIPQRKAIDRAVQWLQELCAGCPGCHFHLVLGNHDYHQGFIDRLVILVREVANLSWHRYYVRLGSSVFLHGDVADRQMDARMLAEAREEWLDHRRRGPFLSMLYDMVVLTRLHKPVPRLVFSKRIVVRRILKYLESIGEGPGNGVHNVYFGHTHRKLTNYRYRGLAFHNGGAPIKGLKFRIIEARR
jgi:UDP-2,3-diacylglucosamine pyrophosphatase LpxH